MDLTFTIDEIGANQPGHREGEWWKINNILSFYRTLDIYIRGLSENTRVKDEDYPIPLPHPNIPNKTSLRGHRLYQWANSCLFLQVFSQVLDTRLAKTKPLLWIIDQGMNNGNGLYRVKIDVAKPAQSVEDEIRKCLEEHKGELRKKYDS